MKSKICNRIISCILLFSFGILIVNKFVKYVVSFSDTGDLYPSVGIYDDNFNESNENKEYESLPSNPDMPMASIVNPAFYNQQLFLSNYFKNLDINMPQNRYGTCSLVTISNLFSYYDTYWSDLIIDEQYEENTNVFVPSKNDNSNFNSPGLIDDGVTYNYQYFETLDKQFTTQQKNTESYHIFESEWEDATLNYINNVINTNTYTGFLMSLCLQNGYYLPHSLTNTGYQKSPSISYENMENLINDVIVANNLSSSISSDCLVINVSHNINSSNQILSFIKTKLQNGQPVIMGGTHKYWENGAEKYSDHVSIAYEYDEINDIIYGNQGWRYSGYTHDNLTSYYNHQVKAAYSLNINENMAHNHSNHYRTNGSSSFFCSCKLLSHIHNYAYLNKNDSTHYRKCICELIPSVFNHAFTRTLFVGGMEYAECGSCHYLKYVGNSPIPGV